MIEDAVLLWLEEDNPLEELDMGVFDESEFGKAEVGNAAEIGLGEDVELDELVYDEVDAVSPFALVDVADICDSEVVGDDEVDEALKKEEVSRDVGG
ncbi:MAG: hypothetical protein Q9215_006967 [Flavoplaca cf. flavocitrina]